MKKLIIFVVIAATVGLVVRQCRADLADAELQSEATLQGEANTINEETPRMVNDATELTKVTAEQGGLIYTYRLVNYEGGLVNVTQMRSDILRAACSDATIRKEILDHGISLKVNVTDKYGLILTTVAVLPNSC